MTFFAPINIEYIALRKRTGQLHPFLTNLAYIKKFSQIAQYETA
jgi:hypothetical protein